MRLALMPLFVAISFMFAGATAAMDKENTLYIDLKDGRVVIEMRPDLAPNHVKQIKKLAREGKYDGVSFHRVIEGFMAQTGDPDRHRLGRHGRPAQGRILQGAACPRHRLDGPHQRSQQRAQPVLHRLQGLELPRRPVHGVGQGRVGHGVRRQDQERRARLGCGRSTRRQDDQGPGRGRREELTSIRRLDRSVTRRSAERRDLVSR